MANKIGHITIFVKNYEEAVKFYVESMGFELKTDIPFGNGFRWVTVAPPRSNGSDIVFVVADTEEKARRIGNQAADHVFLTIETDDCVRDYNIMKSKGVKFYGEPKKELYGTEVVFEDLYGNLFDLIQVDYNMGK